MFVLGITNPFDIGENIKETITDWIVNAIDFFVQFLQNTLFNYDGLGGYALTAYNLFIYLGGILLVALCLGKVITQLLSEAEGSTEANIWWTLVNAFKGSALLVIMPFVISFSMNQLVKPISSYFIENMGALTSDSITGFVETEGLPDVVNEGLNSALLLLFMLVVISFFSIKIFVEQAQLIIDEVLSPLCAISIVTENYNFVDNWWRDILSHTTTIIVLTLTMLLFTESLVAETETVWTKLPMIIGTGTLVIVGPSLTKSIWYSSGAGKTGSGMARTVFRSMLR